MSNRTPFTPLQTSDFVSAFPSSRKVCVEGRGVSVPMREISLTNGETLRVYDTSGPQGHAVRTGLPKLREPWLATRRGSPNVTQLHYARKGVMTQEMEFVAIRGGLRP
jgi:phosphomethylpyrimidine synthase